MPKDNCSEAKGDAPGGIRLLRVGTLGDALGDLDVAARRALRPAELLRPRARRRSGRQVRSCSGLVGLIRLIGLNGLIRGLERGQQRRRQRAGDVGALDGLAVGSGERLARVGPVASSAPAPVSRTRSRLARLPSRSTATASRSSVRSGCAAAQAGRLLVGGSSSSTSGAARRPRARARSRGRRPTSRDPRAPRRAVGVGQILLLDRGEGALGASRAAPSCPASCGSWRSSVGGVDERVKARRLVPAGRGDVPLDLPDGGRQGVGAGGRLGGRLIVERRHRSMVSSGERVPPRPPRRDNRLFPGCWARFGSPTRVGDHCRRAPDRRRGATQLMATRTVPVPRPRPAASPRSCVVLLLIIGAALYVRLYTDLLFFRSVSASKVFTTVLAPASCSSSSSG